MCDVAITGVAGITQGGALAAILVSGTAEDCASGTVVVNVSCAGGSLGSTLVTVTDGVWEAAFGIGAGQGCGCGETVSVFAFCQNNTLCSDTLETTLNCEGGLCPDPRLVIASAEVARACNGTDPDTRSVELRAIHLAQGVAPVAQWDFGDGSPLSAPFIFQPNALVSHTHDYTPGAGIVAQLLLTGCDPVQIPFDVPECAPDGGGDDDDDDDDDGGGDDDGGDDDDGDGGSDDNDDDDAGDDDSDDDDGGDDPGDGGNNDDDDSDGDPDDDPGDDDTDGDPNTPSGGGGFCGGSAFCCTLCALIVLLILSIALTTAFALGAILVVPLGAALAVVGAAHVAICGICAWVRCTLVGVALAFLALIALSIAIPLAIPGAIAAAIALALMGIAALGLWATQCT